MFFCEHCGTSLKNRYFIKSSDGKVSVVGVDCLNKTGDRGLIESVKAEKRKKKEKDRLSNIENKIEERKKRDIEKFGKTREEILDEIKTELDLITKESQETVENFSFYHEMIKSNFGASMASIMMKSESLSENMKRSLLDMMSKIASGGARKNSVKYKEGKSIAEDKLNDLYESLSVLVERKAKLIEKRNSCL